MAQAPFFRSPLSDLTGTIWTSQPGGHCAKLEMKFVNCLEAYGADRAMTKCSTILEDLNECFTDYKQRKRVLEMRKERQRQIAAGERSKEDAYSNPKFDSYPYF